MTSLLSPSILNTALYASTCVLPVASMNPKRRSLAFLPLKCTSDLGWAWASWVSYLSLVILAFSNISHLPPNAIAGLFAVTAYPPHAGYMRFQRADSAGASLNGSRFLLCFGDENSRHDENGISYRFAVRICRSSGPVRYRSAGAGHDLTCRPNITGTRLDCESMGLYPVPRGGSWQADLYGPAVRAHELDQQRKILELRQRQLNTTRQSATVSPGCTTPGPACSDMVQRQNNEVVQRKGAPPGCRSTGPNTFSCD